MRLDSVVQEVVDRIVDAVHPKQVILFGSRARGEARPDSDLDFLSSMRAPYPSGR